MNVELHSPDHHKFDTYVATPKEKPQRAVVIIQEIFGVNSHIRAVTDGYASAGFLAVAPALFDREERGVELAYTEGQRGMQIAGKIGIETAMVDVKSAVEHAATQVGDMKRVAVAGFCWGGTLAWLAATRVLIGAAVGYYGGHIVRYLSEKPACPVMLHFGTQDKSIPLSDVDKIRAAHPNVPVFTYDAGHGFNCDQRASYEPKSAALARQRTLEFLQKNL
jgi:carboxymethylenebutenolidase